MQIKFSYKMAKSDCLMMFRANTVQENKRILLESCRKSRVEERNKADFQKLFNRLNHNCRMRSNKEEGWLNVSLYNKNVKKYTYGPITGFPSGSWWGIRMDCSRDRVHDPFNEDVQSGPYGVTSICTPNTNANEDVDFGDFLTFTGQEYNDGETDEPLLKNYQNRIPVRLIRSYDLLNEFAPKTGYRYDGIYLITDYWIGINSESVKYYKFLLVRLKDQEPPTWGSEMSPTAAKKSFSTLYPMPGTPKSYSGSPSTYKFQKYSHGSSNVIKKGQINKTNEITHLLDMKNKVSLEKQKNVPESAIITRHVFKKTTTEGASTSNTSSTSDNKSLSQFTVDTSKTHSTNISIRTGLYDSSHSVQQDTRKSSLLQFCRASKPVNLLNTNMRTENCNLPLRDKSKILDSKAQLNSLHEPTKRIDYNSPNTTRSDLLKMKSTSQDKNQESMTSKSDAAWNVQRATSVSPCKYEINKNKIHNGITSETKEKFQNPNSLESPAGVLNSNNPEYEIETLVRATGAEDVQGLRSLGALDSLTPDKILHLISKEKYNPLSKLLMGNMIGLTSQQSIALKTRDLANKQEDDKTAMSKTNVEESTGRKNFKATSDDLISTRCYKFRRRKRLSRRMLNKTNVDRCEKDSSQSLDAVVQNSTLRNMYNGYQTDASKREMLSSNEREKDLQKKSHGRNNAEGRASTSTHGAKKTLGNRNEIKTRLRTVKAIKSSVKKYVHKKKRREIANLSIDANFSPKVRGPRNRRLRCIETNVYTKRSYEPFSTVIRTLNNHKRNSEVPEQRPTFNGKTRLRKVGGYKRIRSIQTRNVKRPDNRSLKQNRTHKTLEITSDQKHRKIADKKPRMEKDLANRNVNVNDDNDKRSKITEVGAKTIQAVDAVPKSRKRRSMQRGSAGLSRNGVEGKIDHDTGATKRCTTDAITQCSLIKEPLQSNSKGRENGDNTARSTNPNKHTFIKVEYNDPKCMQCETMHETVVSNNDNYEICEAHRSDTTETHDYSPGTDHDTEYPKSSNVSFNGSVSSTGDQQDPPGQRVSAFVPVNVLDSDLRIARLRSIGFKPITSHPISIMSELPGNKYHGKCHVACSSKVTKQDVAAKYNKYANEENNVVVYMDDELQYQDIEDEDAVSMPKRRRGATSKSTTARYEKMKRESLEKEFSGNSLDQESEVPWHGWRKVVTSGEPHWIGW